MVRYLCVHWPLDGAVGTFGSSAVFGLDQQPRGCQVGILASGVCHMHITQMEKLGKTVCRYLLLDMENRRQYTAAKVYFLSSMIAVLLLASVFLRGEFDGF